MTITLYDFPSTLPGSTFSPNAAKVRLALDLKGIAYETTWIEWPDLGSAMSKINAPPTWTRLDGSPGYSVPIIHDSSTGRTISDSFNIVVYLDEQYPETRRLIPAGLRAVMQVFIDQYEDKTDSWTPFVVPQVWKVLNPASQGYFRETRERHLGKLEDLVKPGDIEVKWKDVEKSFEWPKERLRVNEQEGFTEGYFIGGQLTFADVVLVAWIRWWKVVFGEASEEWGNISQIHGGVWAKQVEKVELEAGRISPSL